MTSPTSSNSTCSIADFYKILFDPGELTCFSESVRGVDLFPAHGIEESYPVYERIMYFSINAMAGKRADANVTTFRNILIENDNVPISEQIDMIKKIKLPYSAATHSGNKSIHFIVSLETPLATRELYNYVVQWIMNIVNKDVPEDRQFDTKTKNASRFSRVPGGTNVKRDDSGKVYHCKPQKLLQLKGRVPDVVMEEWLLAHPECKPTEAQRAAGSGSIVKSDRLIDKETAEEYCKNKWPLLPGQKQGAIYSWARFLAGNTAMTPDEAIELIYQNDEGKHCLHHEYERAVYRCYSILEEAENTFVADPDAD